MKKNYKLGAIISILLIAGASLIFINLRLKFMENHETKLDKFSINSPPPTCARWKDYMPKHRDVEAFEIYISARKLWRSKPIWRMDRADAEKILHDVSFAAEKGDWGARALLENFYLYGFGPVESNHVLDPAPEKGVHLMRQAVAAGIPFGYYDLGTAFEQGIGGIAQNHELAWRYYLKAAQLGSPEAQMALAEAYAKAGRTDAEITMLQCAFRQNHGPAAYHLGVKAEVSKKNQDALRFYQTGVTFGNQRCADVLSLLFSDGQWVGSKESDLPEIRALGITIDPVRDERYSAISDALQINPDLKLDRLNDILPLPPKKLPEWHGIEGGLALETGSPPSY